jgi:hypothetical protein
MRKPFASNPFVSTKLPAAIKPAPASQSIIAIAPYRHRTSAGEPIINPQTHNLAMDRLVARLNRWLGQVEAQTQALRPPLS